MKYLETLELFLDILTKYFKITKKLLENYDKYIILYNIK